MLSFLENFRHLWGDLAAIGSALTWAFAIIFFQKAGTQMRSIPLNLFKNSVGIVFILISLLVLEVPLWPELPARTWWIMIISAVLGITIADVLMIASLRRLGAGMQAVVDCAYAPSILIAAFFMFGEVLPSKDLLGGALVLLAVWVGSHDPQLSKQPGAIGVGITFGILAHVTMGVAILMLREVFPQASLLWLIGVRLLIANIALFLFCVLGRRWKDIKEAWPPRKAIWPLSLGAFLGTYIAILLWAAGFKYTLAGRAAIYNQLSTLFIILLAWWLLKEKMTRQRVAAVLLGLGGAVIVSL